MILMDLRMDQDVINVNEDITKPFMTASINLWNDAGLPSSLDGKVLNSINGKSCIWSTFRFENHFLETWSQIYGWKDLRIWLTNLMNTISNISHWVPVRVCLCIKCPEVLDESEGAILWLLNVGSMNFRDPDLLNRNRTRILEMDLLLDQVTKT